MSLFRERFYRGKTIFVLEQQRQKKKKQFICSKLIVTTTVIRNGRRANVKEKADAHNFWKQIGPRPLELILCVGGFFFSFRFVFCFFTALGDGLSGVGCRDSCAAIYVVVGRRRKRGCRRADSKSTRYFRGTINACRRSTGVRPRTRRRPRDGVRATT